jgi:lipoyl(octanoyl) transferase
MLSNKVDFIISRNAVDYKAAMEFMKQKVGDILAGRCNQAIWLLEHPCTYTGGSTATTSDILDYAGIPYYQTDRGGKITFHGPGQKIIYTMLDLKSLYLGGIDIKHFIKMLCQCISSVLQYFSIKTAPNHQNIGLWVRKNNVTSKIASIGLKIKRSVCYHGISLNVNPELSHFNNIIACGLKNHSFTSIEKLLGKNKFEPTCINDLIMTEFCNVFCYKIESKYNIELS